VSTEAVVAAIHESIASRAALRISGRSTWLSAGRPVKAEKSLTLREDAGVVAYVPGDLTLTVRAGTTLAEIESLTSEHDQWLPLDPPGAHDGTIGATIATASVGPLATSFGLPRDLLLGLEFVSGRGDVVRGGGNVVKNVAGFDLSRLLTGSWGTLGVITEVSLRLYARPTVDRTFTTALGSDEKSATALIRAITLSPLTPFSLELVNGNAARQLALGDKPVCLIRLGGNSAVVEMQIKALSKLARLEEADQSIWASFGELDRGADSVIRISTLPTRFLGTAAGIVADTPTDVVITINPRRGVMRLATLQGRDASSTDFLESGMPIDFPHDGSGSDTALIFEKLPEDVWPMVSPSVVADPLSRGVRKVFDPHNILNPGILGDS
jgi:glycolate oxidase FAD binding subunit